MSNIFPMVSTNPYPQTAPPFVESSGQRGRQDRRSTWCRAHEERARRKRNNDEATKMFTGELVWVMTLNWHKEVSSNCLMWSTVRMFKCWAHNWFFSTPTAPSFYIERLVYQVPDQHFFADMAWTFFSVANYIVSTITRSSVVYRVVGDKDVLVAEEWLPAHFDMFSRHLRIAVQRVAQVLNITSALVVQWLWQEAFHE